MLIPKNLKLEWEPDFFQIKLTFTFPSDATENLRAIWSALSGGLLGISETIDYEEDIWINSVIWLEDQRFYVGANVESNEIIIATDRREYNDDRIDGTIYDQPPNLDFFWPEFIKPMKKILSAMERA